VGKTFWLLGREQGSQGHERGIPKIDHKEQAHGARYSGVTCGKVLGGYMYHILWNTLGVAEDASDHQDENTC